MEIHPIESNRKTPVIQNAIDILVRDFKNGITQVCNAPKPIVIERALKEDKFVESFQIIVSETAVKISTQSDLGVVYALFYTSEKFLGVLPFCFWEQQKVEQKNTVTIKAGEYTSEANAVRFRGWFLNDEVLLQNWNPVADDPKFAWRMAFETLLRCGGNMTIPGTDHNSKIYRKLAVETGLWVTHHHAEPLGAEMFLRVWPQEEANYDKNRDKFLAIWEQAIIEQSDSNVVWALGFRGQGDHPFWEEDPSYDTNKSRGELISQIINEQYMLVHKHIENPVCCINLYGEILELYNEGYLTFPEDVICIWADSGYGKMVSRRQNNHNPRVPAIPETTGAHGIYYHASFYDLQASNHITMPPNSADFFCEELRKAYTAGCDDYWVINCGNIRPQSYMLDLIAGAWKNPTIQAEKHLYRFIEQYYQGDERVGDFLREFAQHTVQYGNFSDEKVGEQIYHYPVRELTAAWMKQEQKQSVETLWWLCGKESMAGTACKI